jgi:hypothetical protein
MTAEVFRTLQDTSTLYLQVFDFQSRRRSMLSCRNSFELTSTARSQAYMKKTELSKSRFPHLQSRKEAEVLMFCSPGVFDITRPEIHDTAMSAFPPPFRHHIHLLVIPQKGDGKHEDSCGWFEYTHRHPRINPLLYFWKAHRTHHRT